MLAKEVGCGMSRILITGACGYLGSVLCEQLISVGGHREAADRESELGDGTDV